MAVTLFTFPRFLWARSAVIRKRAIRRRIRIHPQLTEPTYYGSFVALIHGLENSVTSVLLADRAHTGRNDLSPFIRILCQSFGGAVSQVQRKIRNHAGTLHAAKLLISLSKTWHVPTFRLRHETSFDRLCEDREWKFRRGECVTYLT